MINLLPPEARRKVSQEYWIRVCIVWLWMIAGAFLITGILLIPTYILVTSQQKNLGAQFDRAQSQQETFVGAEKIVKESNQLATHLVQATRTLVFSDLIKELDFIAGEGVDVLNFRLDQNDTGISNIQLSGSAKTRSALAQFSNDIESHALFSEAKLPISNLAKDRDIIFSVTVTLADNE